GHVHDNIQFDGLVGPGKLLVGSAGNEGDRPMYIGRNFSNTDTSMYTFLAAYVNGQARNSGPLLAELWGVKNDQFNVNISIYNTATNSFEAQTGFVSSNSNNTFQSVLQGTNNVSVQYLIYTEINPQNGKPHMIIQALNFQPDNDRKILLTIRGQNTSIKMWATNYGANNENIFTNFGYGGVFSGSTTSTISEVGGTGKSVITVGSYVSKRSWNALNGSTYTYNSSYIQSMIAPYSSKGPTPDGRTKPDITAPGTTLASSLNSFYTARNNTNYIFNTDKITKNGKDYYFFMSQGTSMAAPMVTGIIALWMERYPELTKDQAIELIKTTAITDAFTGTIPAQGSNTWGWGKIDAFGGQLLLNNSIPSKPNYNPPVYCAEQNNILVADSGHNGYQWSTGDSTRSITQTKVGKYAYRVRNQKGYYSQWSDSAEIHPLPNATITSLFNDILTAGPAHSYQWYKDGSPISGANQQSHKVDTTGEYYVVVTDSNGCSKASASIRVIPTGIEQIGRTGGINVFPNPATNNITISGLKDVAHYQISDLSGRVMSSGDINTGTQDINISGLSSGMYILHIDSAGEQYMIKLSKQ
ncbi:MAG: S8 family peptidase, partial [Chitinophagaceae bacterium]|nr:S8 family peptidase [Chitinophagaceae bacterium]